MSEKYVHDWFPEVYEFLETCESESVLCMILWGTKHLQESAHEGTKSHAECQEMIETVEKRIEISESKQAMFDANQLHDYFKGIRELALGDMKSYIQVNMGYSEYLNELASELYVSSDEVMYTLCVLEVSEGVFLYMAEDDDTYITTIEVRD